uniref:Uncharacterized protein n=1 Tax=Opuntia streptacantha TaxID=393608 RepID=A0A7C8ZJD7_OPUST
MMVKFLYYVIVFFILVPQGLSQCSLRNMTMKQVKVAHEYVKNKPVWKVTITNKCYCTQLDVKISCSGFKTVKPVHPSSMKMISRTKGLALLNGGHPIYPYSSFSFTYAWSLPFRFSLVSSQIACS